MNTRPAIDESTGPVSLSVAFNQDNSCFSVGLDTGFCGESRALYAMSVQEGVADPIQSSGPNHASFRSLKV